MLLLKNITETNMVQRAIGPAVENFNKPQLTNETKNNVFFIIENGKTLGFICCIINKNKKVIVSMEADISLLDRMGELNRLALLAKEITLEQS